MDALATTRATLFSAASPVPRAAAATTARRRAWQAGVAAGVALALLGCGDRKDAKPQAAAKAVEVGVVTMQPTRQGLNSVLPGRTAAFLSAEIRPQANGIVQKRLFTEGAQVKVGQPLYQLDPKPAQAALSSAEAALNRARTVARATRSTAARNAELVKIDAVSRQIHDDSQAAAAQAAADVQVAEAAVQNARINLDYTRIASPIAGRVSLSSVTPGALVTASQATALTTVVQLDPMYVDFTQSSTEVLQLQRDLQAGRFQKVDGDQIPVRIRLDDGTEYPHAGRLQFSGVIVNATTGTVTLRAKVPNPDGVLMPNMYVQAMLPTAVAPDALLVPQQAVSRDLTGRPSVLVVNADDMVEKRPVGLDRALGNLWLVDGGLKAGERVVVDGFQRVKEGDKVRAQPVDLEAKASKPRTPGKPPAATAAQ